MSYLIEATTSCRIPSFLSTRDAEGILEEGLSDRV